MTNRYRAYYTNDFGDEYQASVEEDSEGPFVLFEDIVPLDDGGVWVVVARADYNDDVQVSDVFSSREEADKFVTKRRDETPRVTFDVTWHPVIR